MCLALFMLWGFARQQDDAYVDTTTRLVDNAIQGRQEALAHLALDYAIWADAYQNVTVRWDQDWVDGNLYSNIADGVLVLRGNGAVRNAWFNDANAAAATPLTQGVSALLRSKLDLRRLLQQADKVDMAAFGLFIQNGAPVFVTVVPITPDVNSNPSPRDPRLPVDYLVMVDVLTTPEFAQIERALQVENLHFLADGAPSASADMVTLAIPGQDPSMHSVVAWTRERPGAAALAGQIGASVLVLLIIGALTMLLAARLVAAQIRSSAAVAIAHTANRLKSEFISTMSHELRTPMNAIVGYTEMIQEDAQHIGPAAQSIKHDAQRVLDAAQQLGRLISNILDHSRMDSGRLTVMSEEIDVEGVVGELEELMAPLALSNTNSFSVEIDPDATVVLADHLRLQQCLVNLTSNAMKFTQNGHVSVRASRVRRHKRDYVAFEVADTGIGIAPRELAKLFQPFAHANKDIVDRYGGAGLGLSITRGLAHAMGGEITAESTLGVGSRFTLLLPAVELESQAQRRDAA